MTETKTFKVGIYLRLSREDENFGESASISTQRDLLLNYIKDNKLTLIKEYVDDGVSGTTFNRQGFKQMIKDCENKKINMIITKDTSRLGRDYIEFGYYVERYFPENNIRYVAVNDGIDTFSENNSANDMLAFKSVLNDMYVKDISLKLRSSLYTKKRNGLFVGCYAPYGYKKDRNDKHKLVIDESAAKIVRIIFKMFIEGNSISKICDTLTNKHIPTPSIHKNMNIGQPNYHYGVWSSRTVEDILKNPTYIGNLTQNKQKKINYKTKKRIRNKQEDWIIKEGVIDPIIDKETFNLVQLMFKSNKNHGKKNSVTDKLLLRGLIFCKECGHTIGFRQHKQQTKKYGLVTRIYGNCNYWAKRKKQKVCTPHSVKYDVIEKIVLRNLKYILKQELNENNINKILNNSNILKNKQNTLKHQIIKINNDIEKTNKKIDACYIDKLEGNIDLKMFKRIHNSLIQELYELKKNKEHLKNTKNNIDNKYHIEKIKEIINMKNPPRSLIVLLIEKIEIDENNNIDIYYKFKLI